jgi:hypothetical protein
VQTWGVCTVLLGGSVSTTRTSAQRRPTGGRLRLLWCACLVGLSLLAFTVAGPAKAGASTAISIGNSACGKVTMTPSTKLSGGSKVSIKVDWTGRSGSGRCSVEPADCPTFWGTCHAGYWLAGIFCSTLAAANLATAQSDCDLHDVMVLTDENAGPNNAPDNQGTSWNRCSTVKTLGGIFGGLPGTLYCLADGDGGDGWTVHFPVGSATGTSAGPIPATGSSVPFRPAKAGVDCPPSAANIKAGAIPGMCAFVVLPIEFTYYCVTDVCVPDVSLPHDGAKEVTKDYLAAVFSYTTGASTSR